MENNSADIIQDINSNPQSTSQPRRTPTLIVFILFFILPPTALFISFRQKIYHKLLPIVLWIYSILLLITFGSISISTIPQMRELYKSINQPYLETTDIVIYGFIIFLILQIIFGLIVWKFIKINGFASKNLLIITLFFFIVDLIAPIFLVISVTLPIYDTISNVGISETNIQITYSTPKSNANNTGPTSDWNTYETKFYKLKYPATWIYSKTISSVIFSPSSVEERDSQSIKDSFNVSISNPKGYHLDFLDNCTDNCPVVEKTSFIEIDGIEGKQYEGVKSSNGDSPVRFIETIVLPPSNDNSNVYWSITLESQNVKQIPADMIQIYNHILSGFKFTDPPVSPAPQVACTQDAKQCSDGSWVGRQPPTCEFAPCPGE